MKHKCKIDNEHILAEVIFYDQLERSAYKGWMLEIDDSDRHCIILPIKFCPFCGKDLNIDDTIVPLVTNDWY